MNDMVSMMESVMSERLKKEYEKRHKENPKYRLKDFAELLGISTATMTQILKGGRRASLKTTFSICQNLDWSIDYLVGITDLKKRDLVWSDYCAACQLISRETGIDVEFLYGAKELPTIGRYLADLKSYAELSIQIINRVNTLYQE